MNFLIFIFRMLVQKEDVKEFHKDKEPLASYFKGEVKIEPILRSGKFIWCPHESNMKDS